MAPCRSSQKGLILHSGALGDCLLTLPLAVFVKQACNLSQMHFMGHPETIGFYRGRCCIDHIRPMESVPLHRLFAPRGEFGLDDPDRLITAFDGYEQIISFLGTGHPTFEQNLLLTVHCSHSAEITMLPLAPPNGVREHLSHFYIRCFAEQHGLATPAENPAVPWLVPTVEDLMAGRDRLEHIGISPDEPVAILHPGSGGQHKCWHPENFLCLAKALSTGGLQPFFLVGPAEQERFFTPLQKQFHNVAPVLSDLTLTEVFHVLTQADLFVGNDSGIGHMAGMLGKKTVSIFGPTDSALYHPLGPAVTVIQARPEGFPAACPDDVACLLDRLNRLV